MGMEFHIQTDHKPLVTLFSSKHLEELPLRVQRLRMRMMRFQYTISHVPGKDLIFADTLSVSTPSVADEALQQETTSYVNSVMQSLPSLTRSQTLLPGVGRAVCGEWSLAMRRPHCDSTTFEENTAQQDLQWSPGNYQVHRDGQTVHLVARNLYAAGRADPQLSRMS